MFYKTFDIKIKIIMMYRGGYALMKDAKSFDRRFGKEKRELRV